MVLDTESDTVRIYRQMIVRPSVALQQAQPPSAGQAAFSFTCLGGLPHCQQGNGVTDKALSMYEDHGKPEGTVWDPRLLPLTIGTRCGTNTPPDVARQLLNIKPSALPRWGEGGAIRSLAVEREGTTSNGVGDATQYVDEGRVGGACLHAERR